jgi:flagellar biosynthesis protein FlhG
LMNSMFRMHQPLLLSPQEGVFAHRTFKTSIIEKTADRLLVSVPYYNGKVVLLPRNTPVKVEIPLKQVFFSEISRKTAFGEYQCLELALPYQLLKKDRLKTPRIITVTSGKGGAGKSTLLINLAIALSQQGLRVCIVDCDLGTSNIDVLLNLHARYTIQDVIEGKKNIFDILLEGPCKTVIAPGSSGFPPLTSISEAQAQKVINSLGKLEPYTDIILLDTGPGVSNNVMFFNQLVDEIITVTTPEPHSITDTYAALKVLVDLKNVPFLWLVINKTEGQEEADSVAARIMSAAERFLSLNIKYLGHVMEDIHVSKSVRRLTPCLLRFPNSEASQCYKDIAENFSMTKQQVTPAKPHFRRLKRILPIS